MEKKTNLYLVIKPSFQELTYIMYKVKDTSPVIIARRTSALKPMKGQKFDQIQRNNHEAVCKMVKNAIADIKL